MSGWGTCWTRRRRLCFLFAPVLQWGGVRVQLQEKELNKPSWLSYRLRFLLLLLLFRCD